MRHVGRTIEGIGRNGAVVWSYSFDADVVAPRSQPSRFLDLEGDGETEIIVPVHPAAFGTQTSVSDAIYCFTRSGELKWKFAPDYSLSFGADRFTAPWEIQDITVSHGGPARRIWIAFAHHTWWPGFVVELGASGQGRVVYAQAGRIFTVSHWPTPSGNFLAVGGAVNELRQATLVLVPDTGAVASYPMKDSKPPCAECPAGDPRRVLLFRPSEPSEANHERFPYLSAVRPVGPTLKGTISEGGGATVLMLNSDFSIESLQFSDRYWAAHELYERQGRIDHSAEECPEHQRWREIDEWTPEAGWSRHRVLPGSAGPAGPAR